MYSGVKIQMINVYNAGAIKGSAENGGLSGWAGDPDIINAYSIGQVENGEQFIRCGSTNGFNNTYCINNENDQKRASVQITDQMLASGELCYKLKDGNFRQTIGTDAHPVISNTKPNVYQLNVSEAGYATFVPTVNVAELPAGVEAYAAQVNEAKGFVHLEDVTAVPANNAVIVKAAAGNYYYNDTDAEVALGTSNDLVYSETDVTTDGTQYILAKVDSEVGFYKATGTIAAGKAYFQSASGVKAFYFDADEATGIEMVNGQSSMVNEIYNLAGQRVSKMQKGINIVSGKKVLF